MGDEIKTAVETFLECHRTPEYHSEIPDLRDNLLVARSTVTWEATNQSAGKDPKGQAYAAVLNMYKALGVALQSRLPVKWEPDIYGSIGHIKGYVFTPEQLRMVIESAYSMGLTGRVLNPWELDKRIGESNER